jgi:glycolate oxidase FAD binding subunit
VGLRGVSLYEPAALTLVARAGTPVEEIDALLATNGQRLAFEPMDYRPLLGTSGTPTIGGVVAANISGPARVTAGAARDFLLGVRFVDGRGQVIRNGGRVMKNVTGYDLTRLMAGSRGALGVLTEVALKVLPRPEITATLILPGLTMPQAIAAMAAALGSPFGVTGAAHDPDRRLTFLRIEGFAPSVTYRTGRLQALLSSHGGAEPADNDWTRTRDVTDFAEKSGDVWRIHCRPSEAVDLISRAAASAIRLDWGGALIWALVLPGTDLRARLGRFDGHATLVRGAGPRHPVETPEIGALIKGLRDQYDPKGLFAGAL